MAEMNAFPVVSTAIDLRSSQFHSNIGAWRPILERLEENLKAAAVEGSQKSLYTHQSRGQVLGMRSDFTVGGLPLTRL